MNIKIMLSGICGILYLLVLALSIFYINANLGAFQHHLYGAKFNGINLSFSLGLDIISGLLSLFYLYGFVLIAKKSGNAFLGKISWLYIFISILGLVGSIFTTLYPELDVSYIKIIEAVLVGLPLVVFGIALFNFQSPFKNFTKVSSVLAIVAGISMLIGYFAELLPLSYSIAFNVSILGIFVYAFLDAFVYLINSIFLIKSSKNN